MINFSTLAYKFITGEWRLDRARAREVIQLNEQHANLRSMRLYAGAEPGKNRPTPNVLSTPEDFRQAYERIVLIRAARQMEEDMPFFDGILSDFEEYVIGNLKYRPVTGDPAADLLIQEYLEWQFDQCDFKQTLDLPRLAGLAIRSYKRDGECGFVMIDTGDSIKLNAISGDRIGNPLVGANIGPNNYNGIITDPETGAPAFYDIFRRIPKLNSYVFQVSLRANDFIHLFDPFRFEQYHGVTGFKNAVEHAFDMKQIIDFTKLNIKFRASQLPFVQNELGRPRGDGYNLPEVDPANAQPRPFDIDIGDGVTQSFLKLGEGVMEYPNDFPNTQFKGLMEELKRDCAVGMKLPLEFCYRSESGGVVQRFYVNKAERTFNREKRWIKRTLLNPFKNRVIQKGIDTGFLDLSKFPGISQSMLRFKGEWQMGAALSVDYKNETTADIAQIDAGLMSEADFCSENDRDFATIRIQKKQHVKQLFKDAAEIATETGLDVAVILPYLEKKFPNPGAGLAAAGEPKDEPAPGKSSKTLASAG